MSLSLLQNNVNAKRKSLKDQSLENILEEKRSFRKNFQEESFLEKEQSPLLRLSALFVRANILLKIVQRKKIQNL